MAQKTSEVNSYGYLDDLSIEKLEELLLKSGELDREDEDAFLDAITEVIQRREREKPTGRLPDPDEAWREFQTHFNTTEGAGLSLFPDESDDASEAASSPMAKRRKVFTLQNLIAAAIFIVCLVAILPSALGYEGIADMVGHWSETVFRFAPRGQEPEFPEQPTEETYASLQEALERNGVTTPLAPILPGEFELEAMEVTRYPEYDRVDYNAFYQAGKQNISISIIQRKEPAKSRSYEKDEAPVEIYTENGIDHYIYENNGRVSITWYADVFECSVQAHISKQEAITLIHSIYERS